MNFRQNVLAKDLLGKYFLSHEVLDLEQDIMTADMGQMSQFAIGSWIAMTRCVKFIPSR